MTLHTSGLILSVIPSEVSHDLACQLEWAPAATASNRILWIFSMILPPPKGYDFEEGKDSAFWYNLSPEPSSRNIWVSEWICIAVSGFSMGTSGHLISPSFYSINLSSSQSMNTTSHLCFSFPTSVLKEDWHQVAGFTDFFLNFIYSFRIFTEPLSTKHYYRCLVVLSWSGEQGAMLPVPCSMRPFGTNDMVQIFWST